MDVRTTKEPQYQDHIDLAQSQGLTQLGWRANATWHQDPKRLLFVLSRYKFVAKMLSGKERVLEVGCGDAFATRIVLQEVGDICAIDYDSLFVEHVNGQMDDQWPFTCKVHDMLSGPVEGSFDAAYSLDVIEHIPQADENTFLANIVASLHEQGVLIMGTPSIQSQTYASEGSKIGHINCKDQKQLKALMLQYFHNVFTFSMNDEVVHTGFYPMAHYLFAMGVGKKLDGF